MMPQRAPLAVCLAALALAERAISVIPIPRPRPGTPNGVPGDGKVPARGFVWKRYQAKRATEAQIRAWFSAPMNIGIVTGKISDLVVVDVDSPEALDWCVRHLTYTPWQTKTARGFHLFYRCPDVGVGSRAKLPTRNGRLALDIRAEGAYVIAPGSVHASGHLYVEGGDWTEPRRAVPVFWPGWLGYRIGSVASPRTTDHLWRANANDCHVYERARRYLASIPPPEIGGGSDATTYRAACRLVRGFDLSDRDAVALLWEWAGRRPGWTPEWIEAKVRHARRYGTEPTGALR